MNTDQVSSARLDSWKEVADYLGRDVRTAMRWAKADGLPVHRVGSGTRRAVYAYPSEIDAWLARGAAVASRPEPPIQPPEAGEPDGTVRGLRSRRRAWTIAIGAALVVAAMAVGGRLMIARQSVARAALIRHELVAFDAGGRDLWHFPVAHETETLKVLAPTLIRWEPDARVDVLFTSQVQGPAGDGIGSLMLLDDAGTLRWQRRLEDRYTFGGVDYGPTWYPDSGVSYRIGSTGRIASSFHHHTFWPGLVVAFDRDGRRAGTFVNAGWISRLNVSKDGRYLLASGVSNAFGGAVLAVLDASNISGVSPAGGGTLPPCTNCPPGSPLAYFVVPWSDLARPSDTPAVGVEVADSGDIELRAHQVFAADGKVPELILTLSPALEIAGRSANDIFAAVHRNLEHQRVLDHPFERCPSRTPPVRKWTPARGWTEIR